MRFLAMAALAALTGCAGMHYTPPSDADFAAMMNAASMMRPPPMPMPMPQQSVICTSRPGAGGTATTVCQ